MGNSSRTHFGFESDLATIAHWPMVVREEISTMYINIISGQPLHHSPDDERGDGFQNVGLLSTTDTACCPRRFYRVYTELKSINYMKYLHLYIVISVPCS
jgi:hypothetical protein